MILLIKLWVWWVLPRADLPAGTCDQTPAAIAPSRINSLIPACEVSSVMCAFCLYPMVCWRTIQCLPENGQIANTCSSKGGTDYLDLYI